MDFQLLFQNFSFQTTLRFFLLFAPFFALSMFLHLTSQYTDKRRKTDACTIGLSSFIFCVVLIFFGGDIFNALGININAFRTGVGTILLLDAIALVKGKSTPPKSDDQIEEIAIVPMTIPVIVGPAVIGTMMVISTDGTATDRWANILPLGVATLALFLMLYLATTIERYIGTRRLTILSKITGIYLAALASQMIMSGIKMSLLS